MPFPGQGCTHSKAEVSEMEARLDEFDASDPLVVEVTPDFDEKDDAEEKAEVDQRSDVDRREEAFWRSRPNEGPVARPRLRPGSHEKCYHRSGESGKAKNGQQYCLGRRGEGVGRRSDYWEVQRRRGVVVQAYFGALGRNTQHHSRTLAKPESAMRKQLSAGQRLPLSQPLTDAPQAIAPLAVAIPTPVDAER